MKIHDLLSAHRRRFTRLQELIDQAASQEDWTRELQSVLPDRLRNACRVMEIRGSTLVVVCADGAVATRVRFLAPEIIEKLGVLKHYARLRQLETRVSRTGDLTSA